jgi:two-component system, NarL family, nitrate/nitrite response regulator NarL
MIVMDASVRVVTAASHPLLHGVIDLACREAGVEIVARTDTASAAALACRTARPDLLVVDVDLPDADGLQMLDDLGAIRPSRVLVLANDGGGDVVLRALRLGVEGFLIKADLRELASVIRRMAAGDRAIPAELEGAAIDALGRLARRARRGVDLADDLTERQRQVLSLLSLGLTIGQVGSRLRISPRTVETHVGKLYRKLGVRTRLHAVSVAATLGLVDLAREAVHAEEAWR